MRRAIPHAMFTIPLLAAGCAGPPPADASSPVPRSRVKALSSPEPIPDRWLEAGLKADDPAVRRAAQIRVENQQTRAQETQTRPARSAPRTTRGLD